MKHFYYETIIYYELSHVNIFIAQFLKLIYTNPK